MSTELSVYERLPDPLAAVKSLGMAIAKSRIFGCESESQGEVLAWECLARKTPPLALKECYHLINTKSGTSLTMRADAMLAGFLAAGGRHRIVQRDGDAAVVELTKDSETQTFTCTLEEAKEAGFTEGRDGEKDNWSSPRQRMQMLWARVISDGVRAMDPRVCAGRYAPEDLGHSSEDLPAPERESVTTVEVTSEAAPEETPGTITDAQRKRIDHLYDMLSVPAESRERALRSRKVNSLRSLSTEQAGDILAKLEAAYQKRLLDAEIAGTSNLPASTTSAKLAGPCSQVQVDEAKRLLGELEQLKPGTTAKVGAKLKAAGLKLAGMTMQQMTAFLQQLKLRNIDEFLAAEIAKGTGKN